MGNSMRHEVDWAPYFTPMLGFAVILAAGDYAPAGTELWFMALRVLVPLGIFLYFLRAGRYPELKGFRLSAGVVADIAVGLAVAALWVGPFLLFPGMRPDAAEGFDANAAGPVNRLLILGLRLAGFTIVTPFIEELLVRSFLIRAVDTYNTDHDFRDIPIGRFAWRSFLFTLAWFTFTHAEWEWPVAFLAGLIYNLWLYRRRHIGALILTHAVTNAALFSLVIWGSGKVADITGARPDLWFFL
jgi:CAAX prenyl protease-like protein